MPKQLSKRETAALAAIRQYTPENGLAFPRGATGSDLAYRMALAGLGTSTQGAHRTAASLCHKNLAERAGTSKLQWYRITPAGRQALAADPSGQWVAAPADPARDQRP